MCLALPDSGDRQPQRWWQQIAGAFAFAWMLLRMLGSGLSQQLRHRG